MARPARRCGAVRPESARVEDSAAEPSTASTASAAATATGASIAGAVRLARLRDPARRPGWFADLAMLPALILLILVLSVLTDGLLTSSNLINVLSQSAVVGIAAIGATFVILTGGIDLSTGSVIGAGGVAGAWIITSTGNLAAGIAAGLVTGTVIGLVVGVIVARLNVVPFAVTL